MRAVLRLKLYLVSEILAEISPNYQYPLSAAIYNLLRFGSPEFSSFLHDIGFKQNGRTYKLFCFALKFENMSIENGLLKMNTPNAYLYITTPLIDDFIKNFVIGTFENQKIELYSNYRINFFKIKQIELLPDKPISESAAFFLYSPMVLSTVKIDQFGNRVKYYLRPHDIDDINRILTVNLLHKYRIIHNKEFITEEVKLKWDENYLNKHSRVTKKITINESDKNSVDVIGIQAPFVLNGSPELIKVGYDCGFGENNSMGFGLAELINNHK